MELPLMSLMRDMPIPKRSSPMNSMEPFIILPGGSGMSRMTESAVTDFPQPLSPSTPRHSPRGMSKLTFSRARTTPSGVKK